METPTPFPKMSQPAPHSATCPRVLIADDQPDCGETLALLLTLEFHCEVFMADNGETALELADRLHPHVVILDIEMPLMTGLEVAAHLRAGASVMARPVLVAVTGSPHLLPPPTEAPALFDAALTKPIDADRLLSVLRDTGLFDAPPAGDLGGASPLSGSAQTVAPRGI